MSNEIKEILDDLKDKCKYIEDYGYQYKRLSLEDTEILLDYITNLQQENKNQAKRNSRQRLANAKQQELILKLQKENERLKEEKLLIESDINNAYSRERGAIREKEDYKSRCEKADEFIQKTPFINHITKLSVHNILQNGDDSQ